MSDDDRPAERLSDGAYVPPSVQVRRYECPEGTEDCEHNREVAIAFRNVDGDEAVFVLHPDCAAEIAADLILLLRRLATERLTERLT